MKKRQEIFDSINILFTSVGNKVSLIESFKKALYESAVPGKIIGIDVNPLSAALYFVDKGYLSPSLDSQVFLNRVKEICKREKVSLVVPTRDEDLLFFAKFKKKFEVAGIKILVSSYKSVSICSNKWLFYLFLKSKGIPAIKTWDKISSGIKFPCIVKPKTGKGSTGVYSVETRQELKSFSFKDNIIQEKIAGTEFTIDYFADFNAQPICIVPRVRLKVDGGESKIGITKNEKEMIIWAKKIGKSLRLIGHNTIQCFKLKNGEIKFLEVNPRFGGGASLGIAAGCKSPEYIIALLVGHKIKPQQKFIGDLVMMRYSQDIFLPYDKINNI